MAEKRKRASSICPFCLHITSAAVELDGYDYILSHELCGRSWRKNAAKAKQELKDHCVILAA